MTEQVTQCVEAAERNGWDVIVALGAFALLAAICVTALRLLAKGARDD